MKTMRDTQMDLYPDPMCIPTMDSVDLIPYDKTLAGAWRNFINWILSGEDPLVDPMDPHTIY